MPTNNHDVQADARRFTLRPDLSINDAVQIGRIVDRALADLGSIYRRAYANSSVGYPPELALMRRFLRDTQDLVQEVRPEAFFK
jgi:hypothetical protein